MIDRGNQSGGGSDGGGVIPADLLLRRDRQLRFERGGIVYATDGRIGVLKQVVVDEVAGEIGELLVKIDHSDEVIALGLELVDKTAGSAVFLVSTRDRTRARALTGPGYATKLVGVDPKTLTGKGNRFRGQHPNPRRAIANAGKDAVETIALPAVDAPTTPVRARPATGD